MISPTAHRSASVVFGHGLLPGLRPVRLRFGYAAERGRVDRKRIQDKDCFVITTRPPKRGRSSVNDSAHLHAEVIVWSVSLRSQPVPLR
jgi:hypothetical protein